MITLVIITGVALFATLLIDSCLDDHPEIRLTINLFIMGLVVVFTFSIIALENKPKAIDVYRDKTELRYNYQVTGNDTVITDSVVVFKENL